MTKFGDFQGEVEEAVQASLREVVEAPAWVEVGRKTASRSGELKAPRPVQEDSEETGLESNRFAALAVDSDEEEADPEEPEKEEDSLEEEEEQRKRTGGKGDWGALAEALEEEEEQRKELQAEADKQLQTLQRQKALKEAWRFHRMKAAWAAYRLKRAQVTQLQVWAPPESAKEAPGQDPSYKMGAWLKNHMETGKAPERGFQWALSKGRHRLKWKMRVHRESCRCAAARKEASKLEKELEKEKQRIESGRCAAARKEASKLEKELEKEKHRDERFRREEKEKAARRQHEEFRSALQEKLAAVKEEHQAEVLREALQKAIEKICKDQADKQKHEDELLEEQEALKHEEFSRSLRAKLQVLQEKAGEYNTQIQ